MAANTDPSSEFGDLLQKLEQGDPEARARLIERAQDRLRLRVRQMLARFPNVHRWEDTSDVLQEVLLKLHHTLKEVTPKDSKHFLCLAALHIRRKLLDLAGAVVRLPRCETDRVAPDGNGALPSYQAGELDHDPEILARWTEIHDYIHTLPDAERDLFDLLFYHGMPQEEAATVLRMPYRTLKRRWQAARLAFMQRFGPQPFGEHPNNVGPKA
jgi:RNA polymerase sigma factor (sigma-70 family)